MKKVGVLSFAAAIALFTSVSMTGCNDSCSESSAHSSSSSSPSIAPHQVTVSDPYVLGANVYYVNELGPKAIEVGNGVYEFENGEDGPFLSKGGHEDVNGNGQIDAGEPKAPDMRAPKGSKNINPFQTMKMEGMTLDEIIAKYPSLQGRDNLDFDVVEESADNLDMKKDTAKAAIELAYSQACASAESSSSSSEASSSDQITPPAPGNEEASSSSATSSSSSSESSSSNQITPPAPRSVDLRDGQITPPAPGQTSSSSSSEANNSSSESSSSDQITPPAPGNEEASSSSSEASNTCPVDLQEILNRIDNANTAEEVDQILSEALGELLGKKEASSSSEASNSSTCLPGQECGSSSSSEASSSSEDENNSSEDENNSSEESSSSESNSQITPPAPGQ